MPPQGQSHTTDDGTVHVRDPEDRRMALCGLSLPVVTETIWAVRPCSLCVSQAMVRGVVL